MRAIRRRRKLSLALDTRAALDMVSAYDHAIAIGRPLDVMISIRLRAMDALDELGRAEAWAAVRNRPQVEWRRRGVTPAWVWVREVSRHRGSEHIHILAHVPHESRAEIERRLRRWWPDPEAIDFKAMGAPAYTGRNGKLFGGVGYLIKTADKKASAATGFHRVNSAGGVLGRRSGSTANLSAKAIAAHRAARSVPTAKIVNLADHRPPKETGNGLARAA